MSTILEILPWLITMLVLVILSGFFSASEAAFFSLRGTDRRRLARGNPAQRLVVALLDRPERLLSSVLFGNLVVNVAYFAVTSIASLQLESRAAASRATTVGFTLASLLLIIFLSEMVPKSLAVLLSARLATLFSLPVAAWTRLLDPLMPALQIVTTLSRRLLWPTFRPEMSLEVTDLERAIELSTSDAHLIEQEQAALRGIIGLSELRVDECMRPRNQLRTFSPPVSLDDLEGRMTPSGYLLVTEADSNEISAALNLATAGPLAPDRLERDADPVLYCPWFVTVAEALQRLMSSDREVVAVVNEVGETIGVVTLEDILEIAFSSRPGRSERLLNREPIRPLGPGVWQVEGILNVRRLGELFDVELPPTHHVTLGGVVQDCLQRLPQVGDHCHWGPFQFDVVEAAEGRDPLFVMRWIDPRQEGRG